MSHQSLEKRLQARVGIEIKRRLLTEHAKMQADAMEVARWEATMGQRDALAAKKRENERLKSDRKYSDKRINEMRESQLLELFRNDDEKYKRELAERGLAFRRTNI